MSAENYFTKTGMEIVRSRVINSGEESIFQPFPVTSTETLSDALRDKNLDENADLVVASIKGKKLGLIKEQLAYHHVAQGVFEGTPWMIWF